MAPPPNGQDEQLKGSNSHWVKSYSHRFPEKNILRPSRDAASGLGDSSFHLFKLARHHPYSIVPKELQRKRVVMDRSELPIDMDFRECLISKNQSNAK